MTGPAAPTGSLREQATGWIAHLLSGDATRADAAALAAWRAQSPDHDKAFREAQYMLRMVEQAGIALRHREAAASQDARDRQDRRGRFPRAAAIPAMLSGISRRQMLMGGAVGTAAIALGINTVLQGQTGQFNTGTGERRRLVVAQGLTVDMNALTSISVEHRRGRHEIRLHKGQAMIAAALPQGQQVAVLAGDGRSTARTARFDVRDYDNDGICVTCLDGSVTVEQAPVTRQLAASQSVTYGDRGIAQPVKVDADVVDAWQRGMLIFKDRPLKAVIAEVNRYRPGKIMIATDAIANQTVDAIFYLNKMQDVVPQVQQLSGARVISLPGGVVVLS